MKLRIIHKRIVVLLSLMSVVVLLGKAQSNLVFYQIYDQYNSSGFNPAFLTSQQNLAFSIFPLSGMNVSYNNQTIIRKMITNVLFENQTSVLLIEERKKVFTDLFKSLVERDLFYQRFETSLLNLGYNLNLGFFNFRISEVEQMMIDFKGNFSQFLMNPTFQTIFINQPQSFPARILHYREFSLGYAKKLMNDKLSLGIRAKLYYGKSAFFSEISGSVVSAGNKFYLETGGSMKLSAPVNTVISDEILQPFILMDNFTASNYLLNAKNKGAGIDFGFDYRIAPKIVLSGSVVDLGKINWKKNMTTLKFKGKYEFPLEYSEASGIDFLTKNPNFSAENEYFYELFKVDNIKDETAYSSALPTTFYCGFQYHHTPDLILGVVDRFVQAKPFKHNSISLTATYNVKENLTICSGYSVIGNSYFNLPFAILFKWNSGQTYFGSDNLLSFLLPSNSEFTGITFGTCFYLFRKKVKYKDESENLPFYREKIPRPLSKKGLKFNNYGGS